MLLGDTRSSQSRPPLPLTLSQRHTERPCLLICRSNGPLKFPRDHRGLGLLSRERLQRSHVFLRPRPELRICLLRHFRSSCTNVANEGYEARADERACRAIATSATPPKTILMPTSSPSAHAAVPGSPAKMMPARTRSMMPLISIHSQRPDSSRRCSKAYMRVATPSTTKKTISTNVSDTAPVIGSASKIRPTPTAIMADSSDHQ